MKTFAEFFLLPFLLLVFMIQPVSAQDAGLHKVKDVVIYKDSTYFCAFPSVVKARNGEFILAFRRAPDRRIFGEAATEHIDPKSNFVEIRSRDGINWYNPKEFFTHPLGGIQDPCLLRLKDGTLLCEGYTWIALRKDGVRSIRKPSSVSSVDNAAFAGGFILRSNDNGKTWEGPFYPQACSAERNYSPLGIVNPAYNRGAMYEGRNGDIYWAVASYGGLHEGRNSVHLFVSHDKGNSWEESGVIASDPKVTFNETSMYETPSGDLVAFLRTADYDDQACISRSKDGGKTFEWQGMGFQGHPLNALRLPDNRVLLTYGYRHKPFGIRARILNPECTDFATAREYVLRDDGNNGDLGYTWPVMLDKKHVLVVYYINNEPDEVRQIQGTVLEIR